MYEYRTQTHYGATLPDRLTPPEQGFRLRDFRAVTVTEADTHSIGKEYQSHMNGSYNIPYTMNVQRSKIVQWVVVWERYTDKEN